MDSMQEVCAVLEESVVFNSFEGRKIPLAANGVEEHGERVNEPCPAP